VKPDIWYKIGCNLRSTKGIRIILVVKLNNSIFAINFYCKSINETIIKKQLGIKSLMLLVSKSIYISLKDHLSVDVFNIFNYHPINISKNKIFIRTVDKIRQILIDFKYDTSKNLEVQTKTFLKKLF